MLFIVPFFKWLLDVIIPFYILVSLALWFRKNTHLSNLFLIFAVIWIFIIYISPIPIILTEKWERKYPAFRLEEHKNHLSDSTIYILVLGAGYENDPDLSSTAKLGNTVAVRLLEGIRIYRLFPNAKIVSSGAEINQNISQADAVAQAAVELGVNPEDTLQLSNTFNTEDEALKFKERFGHNNQIILVTDAIHMHRAISWFNHYGMKRVISAPTNYFVKNDPDYPDSKWVPSQRKITMLNALLREMVGMWLIN